jgi:hypothetical protein
MGCSKQASLLTPRATVGTLFVCTLPWAAIQADALARFTVQGQYASGKLSARRGGVRQVICARSPRKA